LYDPSRSKNLGVRILLGVVVGMLGIGMLLYLVPGQNSATLTGTDTVAKVGDQTISVAEVRQQLDRISRNSQIPPSILPLYAQQVVQQMIFQHCLELEAQRLGITVSEDEHVERLRQIVPAAFDGDTFIGNERYAALISAQFQMSVPEFEEVVKESLLEQKIQQLVTDGITVSDDEVAHEYRTRNDKIKIEYVVIKPDDLQAKIEATDAELADYFAKNKAKYNVPERRTVDYAIYDFAEMRQHVPVTEGEERAYYNAHIDQYKVQDRAHIAQILFKTLGKTDAEVAEIKKKADDVLQKAKHGGNFADLAKQNSDDPSKTNGGDMDWIVRGQAPEIENAAFSLAKGEISDVIKTSYGFVIVKVLDRQMARTQMFDEVKSSILSALQQQKAEQQGEDVSGQIAEDVRRDGRQPLSGLATKYKLTQGEAKQVELGQPLPELGNSSEIVDTIFRLRVGDLSSPIRTDRGYAVLDIKEVFAAHPAALAEVRDRVLADYRHDKANELAKGRAEELARRSKAGENFATVAKALGFTVSNSEPFARNGSVPEAGSASQFSAAFALPVGQVGDPVQFGNNWTVYRVAQHDPVNLADFEKQRKSIADDLLQSKRQAAYEMFRDALEDQLRREGKITINQQNLRQLTNASS